MPPADRPTAARFLAELKAKRSEKELAKIRRYFKSGTGEYAEGDEFLGVRMGDVFALAKKHVAMEPREIEKLLESPLHEVRAGGFSLMGKQMALKSTTAERRTELYDLCLRRTDRMNNWDLVDLAGLYVVGPYLVEKPRAPLAKLAKSKDLWERRLAIVSTAALIRAGDVDETLKLAKVLLRDEHDLVHKGTGWMLRFVGETDRAALTTFLDRHAARMPRTMLRYAIERLPANERARYLALGKPKVKPA